MVFQNLEINPEQLPSIKQLNFIGLEQQYLKVLLWQRIIVCFILGIAAGTIYFFKPWDISDSLYLLGLLFILLYIMWGFISVTKRFQNMSYALRQKDISYKSGWIWKRLVTVPFNRIQHVSIDQGPIERNFKLSRLIIYTAGGSSSDVAIPGLRPETAQELKDFIVKKPSHNEEE